MGTGDIVSKGGAEGEICLVPLDTRYNVVIEDVQSKGLDVRAGQEGPAITLKWNEQTVHTVESIPAKGMARTFCNPTLRPLDVNKCMKIEFSESPDFDQVSWEMINEHQDVVATGNHIGNECIHLEHACYNLRVMDQDKLDGHRGMTVYIGGKQSLQVTAEESKDFWRDPVRQAEYHQHELCTVKKVCVALEIIPDGYPTDTTWEISARSDPKVVLAQGTSKGDACLPNLRAGSEYVLKMMDVYNDGICCQYGYGNFKIVLISTLSVDTSARETLYEYLPKEDDDWAEYEAIFTVPGEE